MIVPRDTQITLQGRKQVQEVPNKMSPKRSPSHIITKMAKIKDKERIFKAAREKAASYIRTIIKLSADFSTETLQAEKVWHNIFKVRKGEKKPTIKNILPGKAIIQI